jgi:DNA-binding PadR family transcriptional regulator
VPTQLVADGYVEVVALSLEETGPPSPDQRVYHVTDKGEKELNPSWPE